jgi:hypothetical protein
MCQAIGVVSLALPDWMHAQVLLAPSCAAISLGLTTNFLGSWVERVELCLGAAMGFVFWSLG